MTGDQPLDILIASRSYPSPDDLYKYPFVHRRALAYQQMGHRVTVFRPDATQREYGFEGITCVTGDAEVLLGCLKRTRAKALVVHGLSESNWHTIAPAAREVPYLVWLHGSEIPAIAREKAKWLSGEERHAADQEIALRRDFWRDLLSVSDVGPARVIFPSQNARQLFRVDADISDNQSAVLANPIDTGLFKFQRKAPELRHRILFIRPFDSAAYGNDLAVNAILAARETHGPNLLHFTIVGSGPMAPQVLAPLRDVPGVTIIDHFLTQPEIAQAHASHGQFLVPTRLDTQGVSRDEAMASGLVPLTNAVFAVPEFVDPACAIVAPPDDFHCLADGMRQLSDDATLFAAMSEAARQKISNERSGDRIIPRELALLGEAIND